MFFSQTYFWHLLKIINTAAAINMDQGLIEKYKKASDKLILLDYDGTLVKHAKTPDEAKPGEVLLEILQKISGRPGTELIIITGRDSNSIDSLLGSLEIDLIAEHGFLMKERGKWISKAVTNTSWKMKLRQVMDEITCQCPGSFVEEKQFSIAWHYRNAEELAGDFYAAKLFRLLEKAAQPYDLKILKGNKIMEVMNAEMNKGKAVKSLIESREYDCVLCIGDDTTDEDMFEYLLKNDKAITIKVGEGATSARYKLKTVEQVLLFLKQL